MSEYVISLKTEFVTEVLPTSKVFETNKAFDTLYKVYGDKDTATNGHMS